ncbi:hypothetical protein OE88DRAFT_1659697 [Heliocybe sulcata]|uniref:ABC transporter permease n=1 Tax=Heliocybe sulcata TaxID=5364 RepID=A0A5C3N3N8_9AGAM|nr:hypothetical protein OE88DRAFT_1659697 [Heliocybe sulcata]
MAFRMRLRILLLVSATWFLLALIPFITLLSLPDHPIEASFPQDRVLWYKDVWPPHA